MKVLCLLLLVPLCQGSPVTGLEQCSTPRNMRVATSGDGDDLWLDINWSKVENVKDADPVIGYKVILSIVKPEITYLYEQNAEGKLEITKKEELPHLDIKDESGVKLKEIDVPANKTEATIKGLKKGITYEVGVHAYSKLCKGTLTKKMRIKLEPTN